MSPSANLPTRWSDSISNRSRDANQKSAYWAGRIGEATLKGMNATMGAGLEALWISTVDRYPGWAWDCLFGAAAVVFGIAIAGTWPAVALWVPGSLVGIAVIVRGATMLGGAFDRQVRPRSIQRA